MLSGENSHIFCSNKRAALAKTFLSVDLLKWEGGFVNAAILLLAGVLSHRHKPSAESALVTQMFFPAGLVPLTPIFFPLNPLNIPWFHSYNNGNTSVPTSQQCSFL